MSLNYHLMHPGEPSGPGDPNAAFCLDGVYHLHYILKHPFAGAQPFSFVHVSSTDMLHWRWETTKLQPAFTGHGMFSGTGFLTKEGRPAVIYHGYGTGRNFIALARDRRLSAWEKPYPVVAKTAAGEQLGDDFWAPFWDPDCFLIDSTYYAVSGTNPSSAPTGKWQPCLLRSTDLREWTLVGDFLAHELPDVVWGEDLSGPNFFRLGDKWMLLCISHSFGCRYYIGSWDETGECFVPERHGRMNWRREDQAFAGLWHRTDLFAVESVLTADGRRVMWAWYTKIDEPAGKPNLLTLQALPRQLSLAQDDRLRIEPLRELESLRYDPVVQRDLVIRGSAEPVPRQGWIAQQRIAELGGDAVEIRVTLASEQVARKLFGFVLFADRLGQGLPIILRPDSGTLRVGSIEAPFRVADLAPGEDLDLRIFVDKYMVEVFANDHQAVTASYPQWQEGDQCLDAFSYGPDTTIKLLHLWQLRATNQGFLAAGVNRIWEPEKS